MGTRVLYQCDSCGAEHRSGSGDSPLGVPAHWASVYVHENREEGDAPLAPSSSLLFCEKCAPARLAALRGGAPTSTQTAEERAVMSELFIILDHAVSGGQGSVLFGAGVSLSAEKGLVVSIRGGSVYRLHVEKVSP